MAIASMQKLLLVGNNSERRVLLKKLHQIGCVEVSKSKNFEMTEIEVQEQVLDSLSDKLGKIDFMFEFFKDTKVEAKQLLKTKQISFEPYKGDNFLTPKPSLTFDEFCNATQFENEVFEYVEKIRLICEKQLEIKAQITKENLLIDNLQPFVMMPKPFDFYKSTKNVFVIVGAIPVTKIEKLASLDEIQAEYCTYGNGATVTLVAVTLNQNKESLLNMLASLDFVACNFSGYLTAAQLQEDARAKIVELKSQFNESVAQVMEMQPIIPKARMLYDYYTIEKRKTELEGDICQTKSSYVLEGWLPKQNSQEIQKQLEECDLAMAFIIRDPLEDEIPPTLVQNNKIVAPYESVTNMFSSPNYREIDPNPFVAFFFFIFFGMMLSDAGYGLILTILAGVAMAIRRDPKGQGNLLKIMFMGGISTIIWGIVFGSYFGVSAADMHLPCWFNPIEEPMMMLYLSLGMGIFQMCFGLGINMVALFKAKKPFAAVCGAFSWYCIIIGIAVAFLTSKIAKWAGILGWCIAGLGLVLLLISGALGKKGFKKVSGAFSNLYGIINFFSDLMSYTRIFGLGLATAVIGMVFNQIGMVVKDLLPQSIKFIGWIVAIVIFLVGHIFNIGINALGAYVHNSRLQFVEFFNKFYTGGGELMKPLGSEMKYYYIKPEEVKK